jgi:hypothetical protein
MRHFPERHWAPLLRIFTLVLPALCVTVGGDRLSAEAPLPTVKDSSRNRMLTAVYDHDGRTLARARDWGTVVVAEVDLDARKQWNCLGDFKSQIARDQPAVSGGN